jgi:P-type E1-E2 ATPase
MTPMQERLEKIAAVLGKWGYFAALLIFITQCAFYLIRIMFTDTPLLSIETLIKFIDFFTTAISIIIVAIPEGLPLAVSISVSFSMDAMKDDRLLIKNTVAIETMGLVNEICTGKTATLTKNDMTVSCFYTAGHFVENRHRDTLMRSKLHNKVQTLIIDCIVQNCDSRIEMSSDARYEPQGNGTEVGMLRFL